MRILAFLPYYHTRDSAASSRPQALVETLAADHEVDVVTTLPAALRPRSGVLPAALIGVVVHGGLDLGDYSRASTLRLVGAMLAGTVVIYALGTVGFALVQGVGLVEAFVVSALAFVPFEAVKIAAAVGIVRSDRLSAD